MAHYATLAEYRFSADVRDIRGAHVHGPGGDQIGKVVDVVFDHDSGAIQYLVVDVGRGRRVLISSNHLIRSVADEEDFDTDLAREQLERLPAFDEKQLKSDKDWQEFERRHREAMKEEEKRLLEQYKRDYEEDPVAHRKGSERIITPPEDEMPAEPSGGTPPIPAAELWPDRLAGVFPEAAPGSEKVRLRPAAAAHAEDAARTTALPPPRWTEFEEDIRRELESLRGASPVCRKAA